ncbi:MAG: O-antigen polysaccharide polymerase Wzy [Actinobacteria bacterium]|nr:O-antigen polysaccharide polymerase Wzy [Actinomycetota bacterium]
MVVLDSSRNSRGLTLPIILILAAILNYYLDLNSKNLGIFILIISSVLGTFEIFRNFRSLTSSAVANGNVWVLASLFLIFIVSPFVRIATNSELPLVFARRDTVTNLNQVNSLASIAILGVILGSRVYVRTQRQRILSESTHIMRNYRPSLTVSIFLCIFWLTLYIYWASRQGNPLTAVFGSRSAQRAVGVIKTNGYLVDSLYGAFGVVTAWLAYSVRENRIKLARILFLASLIFVVPSFLQGDRSKSVFFILVIIILINGWNVKVKKIYIVAAFSVKNITETLTKEDTAMAPALAILLSNLGTNIPYMYGESYINLVAKPVPRALWPGKPIEFDTQMMRVLFPSYAASGVGFAFSAISEPLVNFGLTGVVVFFVGIGIFNRRNLEEMIKKRTSVSIFLNAWLAGFMFVLVRGNLSVDFQRAVFPIISGLIVLYFNDARAKIFRRN